MELHASIPEDANNAKYFADEVRAEMARKRVTAAELALSLGISAHTMGRRLSGQTPFNSNEMVVAARRLGIGMSVLWERAAAPRSESVAS